MTWILEKQRFDVCSNVFQRFRPYNRTKWIDLHDADPVSSYKHVTHSVNVPLCTSISNWSLRFFFFFLLLSPLAYYSVCFAVFLSVLRDRFLKMGSCNGRWIERGIREKIYRGNNNGFSLFDSAIHSFYVDDTSNYKWQKIGSGNLGNDTIKLLMAHCPLPLPHNGY